MAQDLHINNLPLPTDATRGAALAQAWAAKGALKDALIGIGGSSPYLHDLFLAEQTFLQDHLSTGKPLEAVMRAFDPTADLSKELRRAKKRMAALLGFAELTHQMPLLQVTDQLSQFADFAVAKTFTQAISALIAAKKLKPDCPWFVLAMGKMGAYELNYSSDIDLIVMFDDSHNTPAQALEQRKYLVQASRNAVKLLSDLTPDGYVFRTDLRLRPNPSVTPICVGVQAALQYYESVGRTWERAAFIKARVCAGHKKQGQAFLEALTPFVWRRYLDFAAIEELHELRLKIRTQTMDFGPIQPLGHDLKLGRGGIREIEFFSQIQQLIAGGRDPDLRVSRTIDGLDVLHKKGWITAQIKNDLTKCYLRHRHSEHCLQMIRDEQTHTIPTQPQAIMRLVALQGKTLDDFCRDTQRDLETAHRTTEAFFDAPQASDAPKVQLSKFSNPHITDAWAQYPALRSQRAVALFDKIRPKILNRLADAADPQTALLNFDQFLRGLPAGVQLFSLFAANPKLIELITDIATIAPALSHYLARNSDVLDAVVSGAFFAPWPSQNKMQTDLKNFLASGKDYESQLNLARIWAKEQHFRIGVHLIKHLLSPKDASALYARLGAAVLSCIFEIAQTEFEKKYGRLKGAQVCVIALGALGAERLTSESDLDLMVIFQTKGGQKSDGKRALEVPQYYARLTQSLITALSSQMPKGSLYEVDMRLRPSGRAGPLATSLAAFHSYQMQQAWTWEHLALMLARPLLPATPLGKAYERTRQDILQAKSSWPKLRAGLADMRARLAQDKPAKALWDVKLGAGGLQDIELFAQAVGLAAQSKARDVAGQLSAALKTTFIDETQAKTLISAYTLFFNFKLCYTLLCQEGQKSYPLGRDGWALIALHCGIKNELELEQKFTQTRRRVTQIIESKLT